MTPFEAVVASKLIEQGYEVLTSGWPDFCAVKTTEDSVEVRFIEVKGRGDVLRSSQQKLHKILRTLGLEVEVIQEDAQHRMQYPPAVVLGIRVVRRHLLGRPPKARQKAILFFERELKDGPQLMRGLLQKAQTVEQITRGTFYRTAKDMNISRKIIGNDVIWELPMKITEEKKS